MKKRYIVILFAIIMVLMSCGLSPYIVPVRPFIQLPGEVYVGTEHFTFPFEGGWTNTFSSALLAWAILLIIAFRLRARSRTADEVPTGFYNFFEMLIEGAYNFAGGIAGAEKIKVFFPSFMTFILIILITNWLGLVPGYDSIGIWEHKPHFEALKEIKVIEFELDQLYAQNTPGEFQRELDRLAEVYHLDEALHTENGKLDEHSKEELIHAIEHEVDLLNKGDMRSGIFLLSKDQAADSNAPVESVSDKYPNRLKGLNPEAADWTIVPYFRPGATDMNFTLAFALIAMYLVQFYGFKYLGFRGYLAKFFPFIAPGFGAEVAKNPIRAIDPAVGLLELVSEVSKVISFTFRLLGNIFAGMVLLFVMSLLLPAANIVFFGLEFFVGLIQAAVFGLLMLIFMIGATESHHGDHDDHH